MAKFETSQYNKIWDSREGGEMTRIIISNPDLLRANHMFWSTKFRVDPKITPTNQEGEAIFKSSMRELEQGNVMDMRAPLGDSIAADKKGVEYYSGVIPDFIARGFVEKATERMYKEDLFSQFGDAALIAAYATNELQRMFDSAHQTLSHLSAQLLSTGQIVYKQGEGMQGSVLKAKIPTANFDTAGAQVWTNPDAKILDYMREKEEKFSDLWGVSLSLQWEIDKRDFDAKFLSNKQVIEWVRYVNVINNTPLPETFILNREMALSAIAKFPGVSPIVIIEEKQKDTTNGVIHGWKEGNVVLRPVGFAGLIRHTNCIDEKVYRKYGSDLVSRNFTPAINGLATVMNSVVNNGNLKEWHTDLMMSAIPTLDEFLYHAIIDTTAAD